MNILLSTLPEIYVSKEYLPPLGLSYVAAALEKGGHSVNIIDSHIEGFTIEELIKNIVHAGPDMLGLTGTCHNRFNVIRVIREVKQALPDITIVAGGVHFTITAEDALKCVPELDVIVIWEGEYTFLELADVLGNGKDFSSVKGIAYRTEDGEVVFTEPRPFIQNLDDLPMPAWHLLKLDKYQARLEGTYDERAIGVMSSRGCPCFCVFCSNSAWGRKSHRRRTPANFIDEVEFLHKKYGFNGFDFWDDTLTISKEHIYGICEEIHKRNLRIKWYARARVNTVTPEMLAVMKDAGCVAIAYGIESGSPKVLQAIKKNITLDQIKTMVKASADLGLVVKNCFMFSLPEEEKEDVLMTINLMRELKTYSPKVINPHGLTLIYPGTEFERLAKQQGLLPENFSWNTYTEFPKSRMYGLNKTIPFYEDKLTLEEVKSILRRELSSNKSFFRRAMKRLKRVRSLDDLASLFRSIR
ncbi:MAG: radical SAM protein [Candidatus Auribacter fodinae]|jgi:radical SAM superfamily enzyme YgiQ (UPF0313 family)|uniref:Radical SAM protein n=1 Tax=Candidatus Auribacter fodinae TaxID=2093366 RepID=A0A3A4QTD6_9BACT|nr:MAG: radical SAM protein [Candidatus Auribacter fodinae]